MADRRNMVTVHIPTPMRSYTEGASTVEADGKTLAELFDDLDRKYPGIRFRFVDEQDHIRRHVKIAVDQELVDDLAFPLNVNNTIRILMAISGG